MNDTRTETAASLLHLVDRAERGSLLAEEAQQLRNGIRALGGRGQEMEELRADLNRVQQRACSVAEALRLNSQRLEQVLADWENERAGRAAEEKRARAADARVTELERRLFAAAHLAADERDRAYTAERRAEQTEAAIARAQGLHVEVDGSFDSDGYCVQCGTTYPCDTRAALDEQQPTATETS
ncbi:hypothetical protein ACWEAF_05920 [Streptomyces sp. NPDC005071]